MRTTTSYSVTACVVLMGAAVGPVAPRSADHHGW